MKDKYIGPVIVIVGPTASGKTAVAIDIAKKVDGEVISADSRTIYRGMDIGTAKPTFKERDGVPHFGFDLVDPGERFTAADFKRYAEEKIEEIRKRGHVPIIAGGTGLYVDALVYDYKFDGSQKDLKHGTKEERQAAGLVRDREKVLPQYKIFGILWPPEELRKRIALREKKMYSEPLFDETKMLVDKYGFGSQAMTSNIYEFAYKYLNGELTLEEAIEQNIYKDWHLAKRQMTWFKRDPEIKWYPLGDIEDKILELFV